MPGRVLAIDPGTRRVGIALSDESATIASPLQTLAAEPPETLVARLAVLAREVGAQQVVVGLPRRLDGTRGPEEAAARALAHELRTALRLPVSLYDERLTSVAAERGLIDQGVRRAQRKEVRDKVAAALILQDFLDRQRKR
ncbi:MAG: Holliday junction resolvase RuvX [Chloroflexi bacterium]|nr:MAG: Holliday junction resolvase RuvX [Chloroflexota bacterium]TME15542.1 MAG: Holliday junction resolvase RuvX [Chloroflexota bacterium]